MYSKSIVLTAVFAALSFVSPLAAGDDPVVLYDPQTTPLDAVIKQDVTVSMSGGKLDVVTGLENRWPGIQLNGRWNLENHCEIQIIITNHGNESTTLHCRLDSEDHAKDDLSNTHTAHIAIAPGETKIWKYRIPARIPMGFSEKLFAMRGTPFGMQAVSTSSLFDPAQICALRIFVNQADRVENWSIASVLAFPTQPLPEAKIPLEKFFPMIDVYGQYKYSDWPDKIHTQEDFQKKIAREQADLAEHPGPQDRNQYGGWTKGPKCEATGHFYPKKIDGKWWLIDPEGSLYWSHGVDCVITGNAVTPITDREFYFTALPDKSGPFRPCYGKGYHAPHNYYEGRGPFDTFDFSKANLMRKYGEDWLEIYKPLVHQRLKSWGINTIANWSDPQFYLMRKTPFTETLHVDASMIEGSEGYWGKFIDPFDPQFRETMRQSAEQAAERTGRDPWCIGYFVQNEISWGEETSLAAASLMSPTDQPAKIAMVAWLKEKYETIEKLNTVWGTAHADWHALLKSQKTPDAVKAGDDLRAFYTVIAEQYFRVINEELKRSCPEKLYLGCRFAAVNDRAIHAAAKYCDVISFNKYTYHLDDFKLPDGLDLPCINGEFHFGALDRGKFHTGLCPVDSQQERAEAYKRYLRSMLDNPYFVGTHWFQYMDQATTGRFDGENYQIGFVDACDTPYPETIEAVRKIGDQMYDIRYGKK